MTDKCSECPIRPFEHDHIPPCDLFKRTPNVFDCQLTTSDFDAIKRCIEGEGRLGLIVECPECAGSGERHDAGNTLPCWFCLGIGEVASNRAEDWQGGDAE